MKQLQPLSVSLLLRGFSWQDNVRLLANIIIRNCMCVIVCFFSLFVPCHAHSGSVLCGHMQSEVTYAT